MFGNNERKFGQQNFVASTTACNYCTLQRLVSTSYFQFTLQSKYTTPTEHSKMSFSFDSHTLRLVIGHLQLGMADNVVNRNGVHTHNGSLHARLLFFIATHPELMDITSRQNRTKTIIDLGAGQGNFMFVAASQSSQRRSILGPELDGDRVALLQERVGVLVSNGLPVNIPEPLHGDFASPRGSNEDLAPYDRALSNDIIIAWFNNAKEVMTRGKNVQHALEKRLSTCATGSVLVSLDRCFRGDLSWHEEGFEITVLRNDVSWHMSGDDEDESTIRLKLYKYTKRTVMQTGVGVSRRTLPYHKDLDFPFYDRSL